MSNKVKIFTRVELEPNYYNVREFQPPEDIGGDVVYIIERGSGPERFYKTKEEAINVAPNNLKIEYKEH